MRILRRWKFSLQWKELRSDPNGNWIPSQWLERCRDLFQTDFIGNNSSDVLWEVRGGYPRFKHIWTCLDRFSGCHCGAKCLGEAWPGRWFHKVSYISSSYDMILRTLFYMVRFYIGRSVEFLSRDPQRNMQFDAVNMSFDCFLMTYASYAYYISDCTRKRWNNNCLIDQLISSQWMFNSETLLERLRTRLCYPIRLFGKGSCALAQGTCVELCIFNAVSELINSDWNFQMVDFFKLGVLIQKNH